MRRRKLNLFDKFLFFLNSLFASALLFSYILPYIPPKSFALLSVLSLGVPLLLMINIVFLIYWLAKLRKQVLLSLLVLALGYNHITSVYGLSAANSEEPGDVSISVLSYNVKQFNQYRWDKKNMGIPEKIAGLIKEEGPDVVGMQEYFKGEQRIADSYEHKFIKLKEKNSEFGLAILSRFPIINSGTLDFRTSSNNNAIFADIVVKSDTIRIINVHLQSFGLKPDLQKMEQEHSKKVYKGMGQTFVRQQDQMEIVLDLVEKTPHRVIIIGDFNNTAYSYVYRELISKGFQDAHKEEGKGFGKTFDFQFFPLRIDFILPEKSFEVVSFKTLEAPYSDHFPIKARIKL